MNIDTARSYATESNLMTALTRFGFDGSRPLVVRNREGRWTAIFSLGLSNVQGDVTRFARQGFCTLG